MLDTKQFIITHVLILGGPPEYHQETAPYENRVYSAELLPLGFTIKPTYGDAFLMYKDDGTIRTACRRTFFQFKEGRWLSWPWKLEESPAEYAKRENIELRS